MFDGYWIWILSPNEPNYRIIGKYLFFSKDQEKLLEIARNEILNHEFHRAKINSRLLGKTMEYVLCLYYKDDSRKHELAKRRRKEYEGVKYRYWKSDKATLKGEYSEEFLSKLNGHQKKHFTTPKELIEFRNEKGELILRQARSKGKNQHARRKMEE